MKKFLLLAAAAATVALGANAEPKNYVVNGDFEQTEGLVQSNPWDWDLDKWLIEELPGWQTNDLNPWSVLAGIVPTEIDDEYTFDGNKNCLHLYNFEEKGWTTNSGVYQNVKGLTVGQEYVLGAIIALAVGEGPDWVDRSFSIELLPLDENCEEFGADPIFTDVDGQLAESDIWCAYEHKFKATTANVRLSIRHSNTNYEDGGSHTVTGCWMDIDDVAIMTPEDYAEYFANKESAGIENIITDANETVTGIYSINGMKVADSVESLGDTKGLYIVKTTSGAKKVIL